MAPTEAARALLCMYKYIVRASPSFLLHESINRSYHTFHQVMSPESMEHALLPPSMEAGTPRVAYCGAWSLASEFSMSFLLYILLGTAFATVRKRVEQLLPLESRTYFFSAESSWIGIINHIAPHIGRGKDASAITIPCAHMHIIINK